MILVPYFVDTSNENWYKLYIFLRSGGRELWTTEETDEVIKKMLDDNGFPVLHYKKEQDTIYAEIDSRKLQFSEFYTWDEINPGVSEEDIWRSFLIPKSLWACPVFKEYFWKSCGLPSMLFSTPIFSF